MEPFGFSGNWFVFTCDGLTWTNDKRQKLQLLHYFGVRSEFWWPWSWYDSGFIWKCTFSESFNFLPVTPALRWWFRHLLEIDQFIGQESHSLGQTSFLWVWFPLWGWCGFLDQFGIPEASYLFHTKESRLWCRPGFAASAQRVHTNADMPNWSSFEQGSSLGPQ